MVDHTFITLVQVTLALCVLMPCLISSMTLVQTDTLIDVPEGIYINDIAHLTSTLAPVTCETRTPWSLGSIGYALTWDEDTASPTNPPIKQASKENSTMNISETIELAGIIASDRHENQLEPLFGPYHDGISGTELTDIINDALNGVSTDSHPNMWAVIADAQHAQALLDKAHTCEALRNGYQSSDYRNAANRKLAEAVSWLL